jgi:hypothetical protein
MDGLPNEVKNRNPGFLFPFKAYFKDVWYVGKADPL